MGKQKKSGLVDREERAVKALEVFASAVKTYLEKRAEIEERALVDLLEILKEQKD